MSLERKDLADLYSLYMKFLSKSRLGADIDKFVKSETVAVFRKNVEDLMNLEEARLPEITSVICHSRPGMLGEKYEKYRLVSPLYRGDKAEVMAEALSISIEDFKTLILPYLDRYSAQSLCAYFDQETKNIEGIGIEWKNKDAELKKVDEEIAKIEQELKEAIEILGQLQQEDTAVSSENADPAKNVIPDSVEVTSPDGTVTCEPNFETPSGETLVSKEDETGTPKEDSEEVKKQKDKKSKISGKRTKALNKRTELEQHCKELQAKLDIGYKELDRLEPYIELIKTFLLTYEADVSNRRNECYEYFNRDVLKKEKDTVALLLSGIIPDPEVFVRIKQEISISALLELLSKGFCPAKEIEIIGKLLTYKIVDHNDEAVNKFLANNVPMLLDYLLKNFTYSVDQFEQDPLYKMLFDYAIIHDKHTPKTVFNDLWDEIDSAEIWKYISTIVADDMDMARYVSGLRGRALRSFIEFLEMDNICIPDFAQAVSKQDEVNAELLCRIIQNYDKLLNKLGREVRRANKRLEKQEGDSAAKVFSAMYGPMEKLEILAYDIKLYDGAIKQRIIATQLMECVDKFRKGLEELEVFPMESFDVWKFQKPVAYDNSIHRYENGKAKKSKQVTVKTLGFRYETANASGNGETEEQIEYAKVVPVIPAKED